MAKTILQKWAENNARGGDTRLQDTLAAQEKARQEANAAEQAAKGRTKVTNADGKEVWVDAAGARDIKEANAAAAPADTYDATLRALARARTQMMMRATNGQAGSVLGIGTDNYTGGGGGGGYTSGNKRVTPLDRNERTDAMRNTNPFGNRGLVSPALTMARRRAF